MDKLLKKWTEILRLKDWDIQVCEEDTLESDGETKTLYNINKAIIRIKNELSNEEKEKTLIHELLHLIHRDELDLVSDNLEGYTETIYTRFHERNIEKIAQILYSMSIKS